jgi:hypothetical protein
MAEQRLHSALAPIDILTREELDESLHKNLSARIRAEYIGIDNVRFPRISVTATAATQNVFTAQGENPVGPSSGDVWLVRRVVVAGFNLADTAKYILFRGSSPSDPTQYTGLQLMEAFTAAGAGQPVGIGWLPGNKTVMLQSGEQIYAQILGATVGNQYILSGEATRVPAEMKGKVIG